MREIALTEIAEIAKSAKIAKTGKKRQSCKFQAKKNTSVFLLSFAPDFAVAVVVVVVVVVVAAVVVVVVCFNEFF